MTDINQYNYSDSPLRFIHWLTMFIILALVFVIVIYFYPYPSLTPEQMRSFSMNSKDHFAYISSKTQTKEFDSADIVILGTSAVQGLFCGEDILNAQLSKAGSKQIRVIHMQFPGQTFLQALFLMYHSNLHQGQTVFITSTIDAFSDPGEDVLDGFRRGVFLRDPQSFIAQYGHQLPEFSKFTKFPHYQITSLKAKRELFYRKIQKFIKGSLGQRFYGFQPEGYQRHHSSDTESGNVKSIVQDAKSYANEVRGGFYRNKDYNQYILEILIRDIKSRGAKIIMLESLWPLDKELKRSQLWQDYKNMQQKLLDKYSLKYVDLNQLVSLQWDDFIDSRHVSQSGREKWSQVFVDWFHGNNFD